MTQLSTVDDYTNNVCFWNPWSRSITSSGGGSDTIRKLMIPSTTTPDHHGMASRGGRGGGGGIGAYTDANFAADMNDLTFAERQTMEEDIHGVADIIEETTELVTQRMEEMRVVLETKIPSKKRQAWDRAIFLRPGLVDDRKLYLLFLRARRFQSSDAAIALVAYFQAKRDLWGDDLLIHRITWNDLTEEEQAIFRTGSHLMIPMGDRTGRGVSIARLSEYVVRDDNYRSYVRRRWYVYSSVEDDPIMQQRGVVTIPDFRGQWKSSTLQILRLASAYPSHAQPFHDASSQTLYDDSGMHDLIQNVRRFFPKSIRMRTRLHFGSPIETEYSLRSFGLDISRTLYPEGFPSSSNSDDGSNEKRMDDWIEEDIRRRQYFDDEWRRSEAPYRDPSSPVALFPNPQDIIMGRNKTVATTWSGNILYHKVIEQHAHRYMEAQDTGTNWKERTLISIEILHVLPNEYKSRFLNRETTRWVVFDDSKAQVKISQSLRIMVRQTVARSRKG